MLDTSKWGQKTTSSQKGCLTVIRGAGNDLGKHLTVEGQVVVGRAPRSGLQIQDLGTSWRHARVVPKEDGRFLLEDLGSTNGTRVNGVAVESPWVLRDGEKIFIGQTVVRFSLADDEDLCFHSEVSQLLSTDPLTGLESKRKFDDALDFSVQACRRKKAPLSLLMMDLDGIKQINDTHGHLFGAHAISEAGRLIGRLVGEKGHACRFGGDEFTVFLPDHDKEAGAELAEAIRTQLEEASIERKSIRLKPTISIGVAAFPGDGEAVLDLVAAADAALYDAKRAGKNCVRTA